MAVKRSANLLGQQRLDIPHLRAIESAVVGDFDDLAGKILASNQAIVVHGMTIAMGAAVGNFATQLVLNTAGSILLHGTASEPGAVFVVPNDQPPETLGTSNVSIVGSFTPNSLNYIGIDLIRLVDPTTTDTVKFRSATTKAEFSQQVPLARTLQYRIVVSTNDFALSPSVAPVAKIQLNPSSIVVSVTDCRRMMFRLGSGGSVPDPLAVFPWPGGRAENSVTSTSTNDPFSGADKSIASFIDFFHAMESRLWEVGGGEHWYSQTTDRDVLFDRDPAALFVSDNENFEFVGGHLHWQGLSFVFGNSTSTKNTISNQLINGANTALVVGQCLYVDVDRAVDNAFLTMARANLSSIGTPAIPGSRHIIAWMTTEGVFALGSSNPVGFALAHATTSAYGVVKMFSDPGTTATVAGVDANGYVNAHGITRDTSGILHIGPNTNTFDTEVDISAAGILTKVFGSLTVNQGIASTGLGSGAGVTGTGGATNGIGVVGLGVGLGAGVSATGGNAGNGVSAQGGAASGVGVVGTGGAGGVGVFGQGGTGNSIGVVGLGVGSGAGLDATGGTTGGAAVVATGASNGASGVSAQGGPTAGVGVVGTGGNSGVGVVGQGGAGNGIGVSGVGSGTNRGGFFLGGPTNGIGVDALGQGTGTGVVGTGGNSNGAGVGGVGIGSGAGVVGAGGATGVGVLALGSAARAPLNLNPLGGQPSGAATGDIYYNASDGHFYGYNGAWKQLDN
jgi:hypothetical protein